MGDLDKNIHRKEGASPYEKIIVSPVEKDKQEQEGGYKSLKNATHLQIYATLVSCFQKMISLFSPKRNSAFFYQEHLIVNLLAFRQLLLNLSKEDLSHDPAFTQQLTNVWLAICNDSDPKRCPPELLTKLNFFISQIKNFPPGVDHSLGYYFDQHAGGEWNPFPYMELLQNLHKEYAESPIVSVLHNWITLLNDILASAGIKLG